MVRTSRYKPIVDRLAGQIRSGHLAAGTRLPTHRALATSEHIALVTASRVYAELEAMGLVSGEQGRGTFVRDRNLPASHGIDQHASANDAIDLSFNSPSVPGQAGLLRTALRDLADAGDLESLLAYQPHRGRPQDRDAVARHLRTRGLAVAPERVLIVNGAQHGLAVSLLATLRAGDVVAVDALTYPGFKVLAHALGLELVALPVTADGPDLDAFEAACVRRRVRMIYTMPTLHNPLGGVTTPGHRGDLVRIARHHGVTIVEDASYAYLDRDPPGPLAAAAPECTVYVSGLSKSVAAGLRVGFLAAPPAHVPALERAIRATTWNTPAILTSIACRWLDDGTVADLETRKRRDAGERQRIAREVVGDLPLVAHPASYFCWLPLPEDARADRIAATLHREHVSVSTAEPFATSAHTPQALRLALGSVPLDRLAHGLHRVRQTIAQDRYT